MVDYDEINRELVGLDEEAAIALLTDLMEDVWCDDYEDRVVAANPRLIVGHSGSYSILPAWDATSPGFRMIA